MMDESDDLMPQNVPVGVVGLGLMGSSIVADLLKAGHEVVGVSPLPGEEEEARRRIQVQLSFCKEAGILTFPFEYYLAKLTVTTDYAALKLCQVVIECVVEDINVKAQVYQKIVAAVSDKTILATNTSAIPINDLQILVSNPERFLGIHWAEPATMTRFLEVICGNLTSQHCATFILKLANSWDKEPTLLKKDIRGFIANRLMYAVYREIFHLIETGKATKEDADKAFRYDMGSWMTLMGIFRRIDYMGLKDLGVVMGNAFPKLSNSKVVPNMMQGMIERSARGIHNGVGLYAYTPDACQQWEAAFTAFNKEIYVLASAYSSSKVNQMVK